MRRLILASDEEFGRTHDARVVVQRRRANRDPAHVWRWLARAAYPRLSPKRDDGSQDASTSHLPLSTRHYVWVGGLAGPLGPPAGVDDECSSSGTTSAPLQSKADRGALSTDRVRPEPRRPPQKRAIRRDPRRLPPARIMILSIHGARTPFLHRKRRSVPISCALLIGIAA